MNNGIIRVTNDIFTPINDPVTLNNGSLLSINDICMVNNGICRLPEPLRMMCKRFAGCCGKIEGECERTKYIKTLPLLTNMKSQTHNARLRHLLRMKEHEGIGARRKVKAKSK